MNTRHGILFVCHANLCRSPVAERLTLQALAVRFGIHTAAGAEVRQAGGHGASSSEPRRVAAIPFEVHSAGTHAWTGRPMHPLAAQVLHEREADPCGFTSRRFTSGMADGAALVLTATRRQRAECVSLAPAAVRRVFTLPQFGRLATAVSPAALEAAESPVDRLRLLAEQLLTVRATVPLSASDEDDLADPVRQPVAAFRRCADEIHWVTTILVDLIAPP